MALGQALTAAAALPAFGGMPDWQFGDFFKIDAVVEKRMKMALARDLELNYAGINVGKQQAKSVDGVAPFKPSDHRAAEAKYKKLLADAVPQESPVPPETQARCATAKADAVALAVQVRCISGNQVQWATEKHYRASYVESFAQKFIPRWDRSLERKAGGWNEQVDDAQQHLILTNQSSILALIATAVYNFQRGITDESVNSHYQSIRVAILLGTTAAEVECMNSTENIDKEEFKPQTELDNIDEVAQWRSVMTSSTAWDPDVALDVFKYGAILGDPRGACPQWLQDLLASQKLPATHQGKVQAVHTKECTSEWMKSKKVKSAHPHLHSQQEITYRVRFLKGFSAEARASLFALASALDNKPFPLSRAVLLSPDILSDAGFVSQKEKNAVPSHRAGEAAATLHVEMVRLLEARCRGWVQLSQAPSAAPASTAPAQALTPRKGRDAFASGAHWVAFARLYNHVRRGLENLYGDDVAGWPDQAVTMHTQLWNGEYDADMLRVSQQVPPHFDTRPVEMSKMLQDAPL